MGVDKRKFLESVYHLVFFGNTVKNYEELFKSVVDKIDENERMMIRYSIQSNVMILTTSLLDELNKFLFKYDASDDHDLIYRIESQIFD